MAPWMFRTDRETRRTGGWNFGRCMVAAAVAASLPGCAWQSRPQPEPEPEREAVQIIDAPLPPDEPRPVAEPAAAPPPPAPEPPRKTAHDEVTILPKKDGSIGGVVVRQGDTAVLLDKPYASALVEGEGMIRESVADPAQIARDYSDALLALPAEPAKFLLYFEEATDQLTAESQQEIDRIIADLADRPAPEISVIGHTDTVGTDAYNDKLSLQRAEHVRADFIRRGIPEERITASGRGKRELLVQTPDGVAEPQNRRVEIDVR
ncbi:MAG TPA: OmpA family protein [Burkholderiales bacterium]|nr:OmpA family protein [Burkholderiales bacterium]